jgi:hypothetical protein
MGTLANFLGQGWRLVEIFLDNSMVRSVSWWLLSCVFCVYVCVCVCVFVCFCLFCCCCCCCFLLLFKSDMVLSGEKSKIMLSDYCSFIVNTFTLTLTGFM